jgi:hypothetical protein
MATKFNRRDFIKIADEHGPECIALFTHGSGGNYFKNLLRAFGSNNIAAPGNYFKNLLRAFGSNNIAAPSYAQCRGPREEAYLLYTNTTVLLGGLNYWVEVYSNPTPPEGVYADIDSQYLPWSN